MNKLKSVLKWFIVFTLIGLSFISTSSLHAQNTLLLSDEFNGTSLNTALWTFGTHPNNDAFAEVTGGILNVHSGHVIGSGGTVISQPSFILSEETLILEMRVATANLGAVWGFNSDRQNPARGWVYFGLPATGTLIADVGISGSHMQFDLSFIDVTVWHTYRIEATDTIVRFYVDNQLVATHTGVLPLNKPLFVDLDSTSWQGDEILYVDYVRLSQQPANVPPDCSNAAPSRNSLWPPNHQLVNIDILGITDTDNDPFIITINSIFQDEPTNGNGDGDTAPDGFGLGSSAASVRAERAGNGNGRVYHIGYTATDPAGASCSGEVFVRVNHNKKSEAIDDGPIYNSTQ
ncbi:MAG: glycoside hydrolase family 16 protein [Chloroflexi bacterium]|nr:glycoside hydrolase family 16 protein [Chloroflexota bacterium]